jgi:hypothetical protein
MYALQMLSKNRKNQSKFVSYVPLLEFSELALPHRPVLKHEKGGGGRSNGSRAPNHRKEHQ